MLQVAKLLDRELKEKGGNGERAGGILLFARMLSSNALNSAIGKLPRRTEERHLERLWEVRLRVDGFRTEITLWLLVGWNL